jgi:tetratricopeptide (TPR) repeat protein
MKKNLIISAFLIPMGLLAQNNKVQTAWRNLTDYESSKDASLLTKAKDAIDLATANEETKNSTKAWTYRAKIYNYLFDNNLEAEKLKNKEIKEENKRILTSYSSVNPNTMVEAMNAVEKVKELDKDKNYIQTISFIQLNAPVHFENMGIGLYEKKMYAEALGVFENAIQANKYLGKTDTANLYKIAITADRAGQTEKSISAYERLANMKYKTNECYSQMVRIYLDKKDSANALNVIRKGRKAFPEDLFLMNKETEFFIQSGKVNEAISNLEMAIQKDPNNGSLYSVLGNSFDLQANPKGTDNKPLAKPANYDDLMAKAEKNYKMAIEKLDPVKNKETLGSVYYNLGALYYNIGNSWYEKKTKTPAETKANEVKYKEFYNKALPMFEKSLEFDPNDRATMVELRRLYRQCGQPEKSDAINEKIKALGK